MTVRRLALIVVGILLVLALASLLTVILARPPAPDGGIEEVVREPPVRVELDVTPSAAPAVEPPGGTGGVRDM